MTKKLVIVFNTELNRRFTLNISNPKEDLTEASLLLEAERLIETGVLAPMQGKPVSVQTLPLSSEIIINLNVLFIYDDFVNEDVQKVIHFQVGQAV
ncbi:DUF2922 domain-containing protein [Salinicoccus roseus]|uniref:DUF2922 domain-containing protein n=1 Tax=Salinicoccus roseus TaxID=45670 RepID=UPI001CA60910|nr:DUF2922 domain-containing protein [Salinicoccus roseus]MBY8908177.1 DUF2922 domain-containing protein [Salinicoccus roseus]